MKILGNGIDIVEIQRIKKSYNRWGNLFLEKVLTDEEINLIRKKGKAFFQSLSARLAAKEATYKAINSFNSNLKFSWKDLEILNQENGSPKIRWKKNLLSPKTKLILSISHTHNYALASAILIEDES